MRGCVISVIWQESVMYDGIIHSMILYDGMGITMIIVWWWHDSKMTYLDRMILPNDMKIIVSWYHNIMMLWWYCHNNYILHDMEKSWRIWVLSSMLRVGLCIVIMVLWPMVLNGFSRWNHGIVSNHLLHWMEF